MEMPADSGNFQAADRVQGDEQLSRQLCGRVVVDLGAERIFGSESEIRPN
jgi:hypothetical protein